MVVIRGLFCPRLLQQPLLFNRPKYTLRTYYGYTRPFSLKPPRMDSSSSIAAFPPGDTQMSKRPTLTCTTDTKNATGNPNDDHLTTQGSRKRPRLLESDSEGPQQPAADSVEEPRLRPEPIALRMSPQTNCRGPQDFIFQDESSGHKLADDENIGIGHGTLQPMDIQRPFSWHRTQSSKRMSRFILSQEYSVSEALLETVFKYPGVEDVFLAVIQENPCLCKAYARC